MQFHRKQLWSSNSDSKDHTTLKTLADWLKVDRTFESNRIRFFGSDSDDGKRNQPRKQLGTTRYLLDSDLSGFVVPTSSRHVITHGLTKGNYSIGVENRNDVRTTSAFFVSILRRFTWTIKL